MYSLLMFLSLSSVWLFVRFFNAATESKGDLLVLLIINMMLVYSHYFGWFVLGSEFVFLFFFGGRKLFWFSLSLAVVILCFSPWAYLVAQAAVEKGGLASNLDWVPRPNLYSLQYFYANLNGPLDLRGVAYIGPLLFGYPILLWGWQVLVGRREEYKEPRLVFCLLFLLTFLPVALVFFGSRILRLAVWIDRYFIFMAVPYMMLVAIAAHRLRPNWLKAATVTAMVLWSGVAGFRDLNSSRVAWESPELGSRIPWQAVVDQLVHIEPSEKVKIYAIPTESKGRRTGDWALQTSLRFHLDSLHEKRFEVEYVRNISTLFETSTEDHFWVTFFELGNGKTPWSKKILTDTRYEIGKHLQAEHRDNKLLLVPIWRR